MNLKHLVYIHSAGNAEGIENDIERSAVLHKRHILLRENAGNNALVAVTSRHLVAYAYLSLLSDIAADNLVYSGGQLVAVCTGVNLNINHDAVFAVRHFK